MHTKVSLIAAPTALSPGGYVAKAYADRSAPRTPVVDLEVKNDAGHWTIRLVWACPEPVRKLDENVDRFVDAAAVVAPSVPDAPWMTMGAPGKAVEGALWRADRDTLIGVRAEGLGTVERGTAPEAWQARADWKAGRWTLELELPGWAVLDARGQLAVAVWQGAEGDRAGLKSVSPGWLELEPVA
jgi:DMSO reductase family type II enzyme heme b subunit